MTKLLKRFGLLLAAFALAFAVGFVSVNPAYATTIQAGSVNLGSPGPVVTSGGNTSAFTMVNFPTPFPEGSKVVVIPMVQTFNGADTPGVRIADVTTTGFKFRMNELVADGGGTPLSDGGHTTETIGWVAFSL